MADPKGYLIVPLAFNPSGDIRALECDVDDHLKVTVKELLTALTVNVEPGTAPIEVNATQTTNPWIIDGQTNSLLRPSPKNTFYNNLSLPAGNSQQTALTVPAGETWRVTQFAIMYVGTVAGVTLNSGVLSGATAIPFDYRSPVVSAYLYTQTLNLLLKPGDKIYTNITGATLNDDIYISVFCERVY